MKNRIIGLVIFVMIIFAALLAVKFGVGGEKLVVKGYIGGEKKGFLQDEEVVKILKNKYDITIDFTKAGSVEMVRYEDYGDNDFLFPSSQMALEIFKLENSDHLLKSEKIFNSPIVLYSWHPVTDALINQGIVEKRDETYYVVDMPELIALVEKDTKWKDIGLDNLYGKLNIICTDPNKSNSGNMYLGLLGNILNSEEVVEMDTAHKIGLKQKEIIAKLGQMDYSSGNLFSSYIEMGMGSNPIVVGYENQLIEFALENPEIWDKVKDKVTILYPEPTVWADHTVISLTENGNKLIRALQDEEIQKLAWEKHGFRTGLVALENDTDILGSVGIAESIDLVMPLPSAKVMEVLMQAIK